MKAYFFFVSAYPFPDVSALNEFLYIRLYLAVRPFSMHLLPTGPVHPSRPIWGLPLFLWTSTFPSTINFSVSGRRVLKRSRAKQ